MIAFVFPGQGSQFPGMGKDLYDGSSRAREIFEEANRILGFRLSDVMFNGTEEELRETRITQPAIFLHSVAAVSSWLTGEEGFSAGMVAGHSLGEFSALVANKTLRFEDGLRLVAARASAMQEACEANPSSMAAVLGLDGATVEEVCRSIEDIVVPANYNCPGQVIVSGTTRGVEQACEALRLRGAKRAIPLKVGGAFHSPLMEPARALLEKAIARTPFEPPVCPVYQNVTASAASDPGAIRKNLIAQLTAPVLWEQTIANMVREGADSFYEAGPGNVLQGLIRKINREVKTGSLTPVPPAR